MPSFFKNSINDFIRIHSGENEEFTVKLNVRVLFYSIAVLFQPFFLMLLCVFFSLCFPLNSLRFPFCSGLLLVFHLGEVAVHRTVLHIERFLCGFGKAAPRINNIRFVAGQRFIIIPVLSKGIEKRMDGRIDISKVFSQRIQRMYFVQNRIIVRKRRFSSLGFCDKFIRR